MWGMIMMTMGKRLKELRKQYHYTQRDVADFLDVSQAQIAKVESDERNLKLTKLQKLCNLYNVEIEYILYGEGEPSEPHFVKDNKGISLETISRMNKICENLKEMRMLAEKHNIK